MILVRDHLGREQQTFGSNCRAHQMIGHALLLADVEARFDADADRGFDHVAERIHLVDMPFDSFVLHFRPPVKWSSMKSRISRSLRCQRSRGSLLTIMNLKC